MTAELMQWATVHWWLAFWLAFWALYGVYGLLSILAFTYRRTLRLLIVLFRGWPPAHLDADGDWKPKEPT